MHKKFMYRKKEVTLFVKAGKSLLNKKKTHTSIVNVDSMK